MIREPFPPAPPAPVRPPQEGPAPASNPQDPSPGRGEAISRWTPLRIGTLACLAALLLYARPILWPGLVDDDFQILEQSWTWDRTRDGLWVTQNEHAMPLGRLLTFGLVHLAGRQTALPVVCALVGPLALLLGMGLVYLFVRRELGHPLPGLTAMVLFGVTSIYHQTIYWFAASFAVLTLDTILLALLAVQRWRQTRRALYLDLAVVLCALAPGWFASGVLAGPLCCLYLLPLRRRAEAADGLGSRWSHWSLLPLLGTALFLAISLPRTAERIMTLEHYDGRTAAESFQPLVGLKFTSRSLVDNLLLGQLGLTCVEVPVTLIPAILAVVAALAAWWWWQAPDRRLLLLGLGFIGSGYLLVYSARAAWGYDGLMTRPAWSRYHLLPQLGLALFVVGGLPGRGFSVAPSGRLTRRQVIGLGWLIAVCFLVSLPRAVICCQPYLGTPELREGLRRLEEVDAVCRQQHISADQAREALGKWDAPGFYDRVNAWEFLRGSDDPRPHSVAEVKRLLAGVAERKPAGKHERSP
jgi:hypothetical protein